MSENIEKDKKNILEYFREDDENVLIDSISPIENRSDDGKRYYNVVGKTKYGNFDVDLIVTDGDVFVLPKVS